MNTFTNEPARFMINRSRERRQFANLVYDSTNDVWLAVTAPKGIPTCLPITLRHWQASRGVRVLSIKDTANDVYLLLTAPNGTLTTGATTTNRSGQAFHIYDTWNFIYLKLIAPNGIISTPLQP